MTFASREELESFLRRHKLTAEKALGQHFLADPSVVAAIVARVPEGSSVLEVGPGPGILTGALAERHRVLAVELDERMRRPLAASAPSAEIVFADALQTDLGALLQRLDAPRALVSNLPYYITAPLLDRFAALRRDLDTMVLMMQREVGDRIAAKAGKGERGSLSVHLQRLFTIEKVVDAPADAFLPPPKVRSVVLEFRPRDVADDPALEKFVRLGFASPRKTLANNLARSYPKERVAEGFGDLAPQVRPHELTEEQWLALRARIDA